MKKEISEYKKLLDKVGDNEKAGQYIWNHLYKYIAGNNYNYYLSNAYEFNMDVSEPLEYKDIYMLKPQTIALLVSVIEKLFNDIDEVKDDIDEIKKDKETKNCQVIKIPKDTIVRQDETDDSLVIYCKKKNK